MIFLQKKEKGIDWKSKKSMTLGKIFRNQKEIREIKEIRKTSKKSTEKH